MIQIDHVTFSYGEETEHTGGVRDIELQIKRGEFAVLCGESGCGKTTITRLINGLIPHYYEGKMSGGVWVNGAEVSKQPLYDTAKIVGSVFQNPRSQFFNVDTTSEITFGCENLGQPAETIRARLERTVCDFRLEKLMDRNIFHLSGGEKQKVACAGVSIMEPEVLVLDEPSSNLDAASISDLRKTLAFWKSQGKTIIVSEHRLYYLRGLADRFIYMKGGKITREYTAEEFNGLSEQARTEIGLRTFALEQLQPPQTPQCTGTELELKQFRFAYPHGSSILHIQDCTIPAGRIVGIIGNNGAGKSTFSRCFCGEAMRRGNLERQAIPFERSAEHLLYGHAGGKPSALYRNSPGRSVDQHGGAGYKTGRGNPDPAGSPPVQRQAPYVAFRRAETEGGHRICHCIKAVYSLL